MSLTDPTSSVEVPRTPDVPIVDQVTLVLGSVQAAVATALGASILAQLPAWVGFSLAIAAFVLGALQAGLRHYVQSRVTASEDVLEVRKGGYVVAGPANELVPAGQTVRPASDPAAPRAPQAQTRDERHAWEQAAG